MRLIASEEGMPKFPCHGIGRTGLKGGVILCKRPRCFTNFVESEIDVSARLAQTQEKTHEYIFN